MILLHDYQFNYPHLAIPNLYSLDLFTGAQRLLPTKHEESRLIFAPPLTLFRTAFIFLNIFL